METVNRTEDVLNLIHGDPVLVKRIREANILLVGAGGIGCEVIKTMLREGFTKFKIIDMDTIDVSNLNRQFLFNKNHVGQSKSETAAKVALERFAHSDLSDGREVSVEPILDSIQSQKYDVEFFRSHTMVINALDNRSARSHVNRMCLAADVPLFESGTEGYLGQVFLIQKGVSACYECDGPQKGQTTYASCTIRNTPSQPIHCIVWGKHLFAQLFGETDADNDVSPDFNDPELKGVTTPVPEGEKAPSTREWAESKSYDAKVIFEKLFHTDIQYLLRMDKLWENRRRPAPLILEDVLSEETVAAGHSGNVDGDNGTSILQEVDVDDQKLWSLKECYEKFEKSISVLKDRLTQEGKDSFLVWDKDDDAALTFVTSVSNLRSHIFGIERKTRFEVKSMAGNIIPAISSTNAIISGVIALQAVNLLRNLPEDQSKLTLDEKKQIFKKSCTVTYLRAYKSNMKNYLSSYELCEPNPGCLVCPASTREIEIHCNFKETTLGYFGEEICINKLNFVSPEIQLEGQAVIIWSKEDSEDEGPEYSKKLLSGVTHISNNTRVKVYDMLQDYAIIVTLKDVEVDPNQNSGSPFIMIVINEGSPAEPTKSETEKSCEDNKNAESDTQDVDDEDDIQEVDADTDVVVKIKDDDDGPTAAKQPNLETPKLRAKPCPKSRRKPGDVRSQDTEEESDVDSVCLSSGDEKEPLLDEGSDSDCMILEPDDDGVSCGKGFNGLNQKTNGVPKIQEPAADDDSSGSCEIMNEPLEKRTIESVETSPIPSKKARVTEEDVGF